MKDCIKLDVPSLLWPWQLRAGGIGVALDDKRRWSGRLLSENSREGCSGQIKPAASGRAKCRQSPGLSLVGKGEET